MFSISWLLFQFIVTLVLLYQQVGLSFLVGLAFTLLGALTISEILTKFRGDLFYLF
jgi:hypothetical protein